MTDRPPSIAANTATTEQRLQVEAELERILRSAGFRTSKRSQEFLRYIVVTSLDGRFEELRERVIGNQVFQRLPDYDTGEHSIVRVKANELRKRLAQFYSETGESSAVQIHLPKGSYTPEYRWIKIDAPATAPVAPAEIEEPETSTHLWPWLVGLGAALIFLCLVSWHFVHTKVSSGIVEQFWQPVLQDPNVPLLCVGSPDIWKLSDRDEILASHNALPAKIPSSDLVRDVSHYVGWGDALALTGLAEYFARHDKEAQVRLANDVSFSELSHSPIILIGARSNAWTMQLANYMRFVLERSEEGSYIRDKTNGKKWMFESGTPKVDYVVLSRIFESKTGKMVVLAAGLSHYGTQVAGRILTDPASLQKALRNAPKDWQTRNMQLVFRVEIFGTNAGEPALLSSNFW